MSDASLEPTDDGKIRCSGCGAEFDPKDYDDPDRAIEMAWAHTCQ